MKGFEWETWQNKLEWYALGVRGMKARFYHLRMTNLKLLCPKWPRLSLSYNFTSTSRLSHVSWRNVKKGGITESVAASKKDIMYHRPQLWRHPDTIVVRFSRINPYNSLWCLDKTALDILGEPIFFQNIKRETEKSNCKILKLSCWTSTSKSYSHYSMGTTRL